MNNISLEMNFYAAVKKWVVLVLYDDTEGVRSSICYYPANKRRAKKQLALLEKEYNLKGTSNS